MILEDVVNILGRVNDSLGYGRMVGTAIRSFYLRICLKVENMNFYEELDGGE